MKRIIYFYIAVFTLYSCGSHKSLHLTKIKGDQINMSPSFELNTEINSIIVPYREKLKKEMDVVLSYTPTNLTKFDGELESSLGNLLADLCYEQSAEIFTKRTGKKIDFTLLNHGGIRAGISKGAIKVADAYKVMPFENGLVVVELSGDKMKELFTYLIKVKRAHPISKQLKIKILKNNSYEASIHENKFDVSKTYHILTNDYLQNGGDKMDFFKNPVSLHTLNYKIRSAIIDYLKSHKKINSVLDQRFTAEK